MEYTLKQFGRLARAVEAQGGVHLDELCAARNYSFTGGVDEKGAFIPGCGNLSLFEVPYEVADGELQPIKLCAVCDDMGLMPRFAPEVFR